MNASFLALAGLTALALLIWALRWAALRRREREHRAAIARRLRKGVH